MKIVFWQNCPSIHQTPLLNALVVEGVKVFQFYETPLARERLNMGWLVSGEHFVTKQISELSDYDYESVLDADAYIFSGFRSFKTVANKLDFYYKICPAKIFVFAERPDPRGCKGLLRKILYSYYVFHYRSINAILTAGSDNYFKRLYFKNNSLPLMYYTEKPIMSEQNKEVRSEYRITYVGSLIERKNVAILLQAIKNIISNGSISLFKLTIVGDGPLKNKLINDVESFGLNNYFEFLGSLQNNQVNDVLFQTDTFVLPSWHDGYGAVVNEALLAGCRVACSSAAGSEETMKDLGYTHRVFNPNRCLELVQILENDLISGKVNLQERLSNQHKANELLPANGARKLISFVNSRG